MIKFLCEYLRINTAHPNPDYEAAINLFKNYAQQDEFLVHELRLPSGNPVLIITLQGSNPTLPALALNHHMDVVPAYNDKEWMHPPFAGTKHENLIIGRGTQDMKGVGIVHYAALKEIKESGFVPKRTIHLMLVPDEERGGFFGTKEFVAHQQFQDLNIGYVLDEGMPSGNNRELLIKVGERTPIQIRITSKGKSGHASNLMHDNCIHALINFLGELVQKQEVQRSKSHDQEPGNLVSYHLTSLTTHNTALNVIPAHAQATIDIRVPSHCSLNEILNDFESLIKKHENLTYEIVATSKERLKPGSTNSEFYKTLKESILTYEITPKPFIFEATTDARFYSDIGLETLGFTPFTSAPNLHGTDESITIEDLELGKKIMCKFLRKFC
jgi:N-acyl-L-amino-acid amidohydrolase